MTWVYVLKCLQITKHVFTEISHFWGIKERGFKRDYCSTATLGSLWCSKQVFASIDKKVSRSIFPSKTSHAESNERRSTTGQFVLRASANSKAAANSPPCKNERFVRYQRSSNISVRVPTPYLQLRCTVIYIVVSQMRYQSDINQTWMRPVSAPDLPARRWKLYILFARREIPRNPGPQTVELIPGDRYLMLCRIPTMIRYWLVAPFHYEHDKVFHMDFATCNLKHHRFRRRI